MKKVLLALAIIFAVTLSVSAQNDTVCAGATGISYWLNGNTGSTYSWTIAGGTQASGGTTDSITIDFLTTTGMDTITVIETDSNGCLGDPVKLAIVRMPLPDATIAGTTSLCYEDSTTITVTLTGTSPWDLTYNDGSGNNTINLTSSPYVFNTSSLTTSTTYTLVQVVDRLTCSTALSGAGTASTVTVYPKVVTPAIQHN
jgi:hypothetical protein